IVSGAGQSHVRTGNFTGWDELISSAAITGLQDVMHPVHLLRSEHILTPILSIRHEIGPIYVEFCPVGIIIQFSAQSVSGTIPAFGNVIRRCIAKAISGCLAIRAIYGFDINRISPSYTEVRWHIGLVVGSLFPSLKRMRKAKKMPHFMCQRVGTSYETGLCDSYCFICRTEVSAGLIGIAYDVYIKH